MRMQQGTRMFKSYRKTVSEISVRDWIVFEIQTKWKCWVNLTDKNTFKKTCETNIFLKAFFSLVVFLVTFLIKLSRSLVFII